VNFFKKIKGIIKPFIVSLSDAIKHYTHTRPKTKKLFGVVAVILGFVGWLLPVVPGLWLMFLGLELLGIEILFFDKIVKFMKKRIRK
jgi:hypothetical protein